MKEASNNLPKPFATYLPVAHKPAGRIIESVSTVVFFQYRIGCLAIDDGTNLSATHADDAFKNDISRIGSAGISSFLKHNLEDMWIGIRRQSIYPLLICPAGLSGSSAELWRYIYMASKIVLITGANTGIGFQVVRALCNSTQTYSIIVGGRSPAKVHSAIRAIQSEFTNCQSQLYPLQIDLESDDSIKHASEDISTKFGRLDALVNNADMGRQCHRHTPPHLRPHASPPQKPRPQTPLRDIWRGQTRRHRRPRLPINRSPPAGWPKPAGITATAYRSAKTGLSMVLREWGRILKNDGVKIWGIAPGYLATGLGGGTAEEMKKNGAEDADVAGPFIRSVLEGDRDTEVGRVIRREGVQEW
ncbi:polyglutamate biosynthesis protein, putative [Aspergillus fumigatus Z5]|nr:polyglutamate biosynthesis protein, putative [Aspergillus fumigatus Z5]